MSEERIVRGFDDRLHRYVDGVYKPDGEDVARQRIRDALGDKWKAATAEEAIKHLKAGPILVTELQDTDTINCTNGLLNWRTGDLRPHSPDVYSTIQLPVAWNPSARCPGIWRFLQEVVPEDAVDLVKELFGYALFAGNPMQKAVLFVGPGNNGKSVLLSLFEALVGVDNHSAVSLQDLSDNRFRVAEMVGKILNSSGDLDAHAVKRTDMIKMVTGGDLIMAERKYGHPFYFRPIALPVFSCNEVPISSDQSEGWFRRFIILPMTKPVEKVDPFLGDKLRSPDELEGLLVWAVDGLLALMARGAFQVPPSVEAAGDVYREQSDSVAGFLGDEDHVALGAGLSVPRATLYVAYTSWCEEAGRRALSRPRFFERVRMAVGKDMKTHGDWLFRGIGLAGYTVARTYVDDVPEDRQGVM